MTDIVQRLRIGHRHGGSAFLAEAADEIDRLRAALKPFADYADPTRVFHDDFVITKGSQLARRQLTMGDCYDAARALEGAPSDDRRE